MRRYETIYIVRPNAGEEDLADTIGKASAIIEKDGGTILRIDKWGIKKLAYLIKKQSQGYYIYMDYAGTPAAVAEVERIFKIDDRIIKFMTVKQADACDPEAIKAELASIPTPPPATEEEGEEDSALAEAEAEE